ncbi:hypothetical protein [Actinomadura sp. HBU206391]|uniref:hypothetical protein n=1 Tax=Actinomadura sp. HBU206391 TaxID=2731692 RepID=UPI0016500617|nr:hypothetical protein [Actinomadura sp. HBU206391]MBC6460096.1 hypothetical protein [Actinomadura sp. HBU206391]
MRSPALIALALTLCGCGVAREISTKAFRNAVATGATAELRGLGYHVRGTLDCTLPPGNTLAVVRVRCTGRTVDGRPITLTGIARHADTGRPRQEFVITVAGREVLRKSCLGRGCDKITAR